MRQCRLQPGPIHHRRKCGLSFIDADDFAFVRFDGLLFFANSSYLEDKIMDIMRQKKGLRHIILVSNGINDIDASGEEKILEVANRLKKLGYVVVGRSATGQGAIDQAAETRPDLILMDIRLKGDMDGIAAAALPRGGA